MGVKTDSDGVCRPIYSMGAGQSHPFAGQVAAAERPDQVRLGCLDVQTPLIHQAAVNMEMRHVHAYHQVCSSVVLHTTRIMQLATHTRLCVCGVCDKNLPNAMSSRANVGRVAAGRRRASAPYLIHGNSI